MTTQHNGRTFSLEQMKIGNLVEADLKTRGFDETTCSSICSPLINESLDSGMLGHKIKQARKVAQISQAELGAKLKPPALKQQVSDWERGECVPRLGRIKQLAKALGVELSALLEGT